MKEGGFKVRWCHKCKAEYVECPKCGNNTCNGGYGTVDGKQCDVCPKAYEYDKRFLNK